MPTELTELLNSVCQGIEAFEPDGKLRLPHLYNALSLLHVSLGEASWVGIYEKKGDELLLGPFQGTPACEAIRFGKGVVGSCYEQQKTIAVKDVHEFPGYICCDPTAKSEICVPLRVDEIVVAILDIDLPYIHEFTEEEVKAFETFAIDLQRFLK